MKIILLKDVPKVGKKDQIKDVADGFAQNALLPKGLAKIATETEIKALKTRLESKQQQEEQIITELKNSIEILKNEKIKIELAANNQGHLFSKFKVEQLKKVLHEKNVNFDIKHIVPFEFKEVGIHTIKIKSPHMVSDFDIEIKAI